MSFLSLSVRRLLWSMLLCCSLVPPESIRPTLPVCSLLKQTVPCRFWMLACRKTRILLNRSGKPWARWIKFLQVNLHCLVCQPSTTTSDEL